MVPMANVANIANHTLHTRESPIRSTLFRLFSNWKTLETLLGFWAATNATVNVACLMLLLEWFFPL